MLAALRTRIRNRRALKEAALRLVHRIFEAARQPAFYAEAGVPDTLTGRFDVATLHGALLLRVLNRRPSQKALAQKFADEYFGEIDDAFRRLGVGDQAIARRVRISAEAFYGRLKAYDEALATDPASQLKDALVRNLFAEEAPDDATLKSLVSYALRLTGYFNGLSDVEWETASFNLPVFEGVER